MASTYPTSLDNFTNPLTTSLLTSPSHAQQHSDVNDAVEALQTKVAIGNTVLGVYQSYTPSFLAGASIGDGTVTGSYCRVNDFVHVWGRFVLGSTSTVTAAIQVTIPVNMDTTVAGSFPGTFVGQVGIRDTSAATGYVGVVATVGIAGFAGRVVLQVQNAAGTYLTNATISSTVPMTWAIDDILWWNLYYKAA